MKWFHVTVIAPMLSDGVKYSIQSDFAFSIKMEILIDRIKAAFISRIENVQCGLMQHE